MRSRPIEHRKTALSTCQDGRLKYMRLSHLIAKQMFMEVKAQLAMGGVVN